SVRVAAPGVRVPAQGRDGQYWLVSGTSPACALTAGVAALIKSVYPALAPALVMQAITASTSNKPRDGYDEQVGLGRGEARAAVKLAGRLARDRGTGRGLVAAAQFGGGAGAIPAAPVPPRGKRQLMTDSLVALLCLAVVLVIAFRLIVARRAAVAAVPAGQEARADDRPAGADLAAPDYGPPDGYRPPEGYGSPGGHGPPGGHRPPHRHPPAGGVRPPGS